MILMINPSTHSPIDLAMSGPRLDEQPASESQVNTAGANENAGPAAYEQAIQKFVRNGKNPELLQLREGLLDVLKQYEVRRGDSKPPEFDQYLLDLLFHNKRGVVNLVEPIVETERGRIIFSLSELPIDQFMVWKGLKPPLNKRELQQVIDALPSKPELPPRTSAGGLRALIQLGNKSV
ncbi:hypothetical protein IMF22_05850 [Pseudomonas poae]|uniref:Uncharacterized protein n=1 Tax=Pseudomonas poae TaxID=200451 RepID=A0A7M1KJN4_9PSED|nr:hypothetical protein [Pseudomonas poae]QOQ76571.1 hypothetical protein IMF22_05850 [Pseudomonas poae]